MHHLIYGSYWLAFFWNGQCDIIIGELGIKTFYMGFVMPDGTITVSDAIVFA